MRGSLLFSRLNALLVSNGAGGLAGGLTGRLALTASGVLAGTDAGLLDILDMLHLLILLKKNCPKTGLPRYYTTKSAIIQ
jgi:hypothetical protein